MNNKTVRKAVLILSGATLGAPAVCIPQAKKAPDATVVAKYIKNGKYCAAASEQRKREILQNIKVIRSQIRNKAKMVQVDKETWVRPITNSQRTSVYSMGILNIIANRWEETHNA